MQNKLKSMATATLACSFLVAVAPLCSAKKTLTWFMDTTAAWKTLATRFEKQNPGVRVQLIYGNQDKFYTMITAGLMPDVWGPWGTVGMKADVNRNWALDLSPYIVRDGKSMDIADFFPGLMREFRVNGKFYSLPIFSYVDYYFYNTDMYAQAGLAPPPTDASDKSWNWDRMVLNAQKMTKATGDKLTVAGVDFARAFGPFPNWYHLWGAKLYSKETLASSVPQTMDFDSKEMVTAFTKVWELIYKYNVARPAAGGFDTGKVASNIDWGWSIGGCMMNSKLKWAIAPLPWAVTNSGTLWPDGWRIGKVSKNRELAWTFVKFLCSKESMQLLATEKKWPYTGSPLARKSLFSEYLGRNIGRATGMDPAVVYDVHAQGDEVGVVKYGETVCLHVDLSADVEAILNRMFANKLSPTQTAQQLQSKVDKALPILFKRWLRNIEFSGAEKR